MNPTCRKMFVYTQKQFYQHIIDFDSNATIIQLAPIIFNLI